MNIEITPQTKELLEMLVNNHLVDRKVWLLCRNIPGYMEGINKAYGELTGSNHPEWESLLNQYQKTTDT